MHQHAHARSDKWPLNHYTHHFTFTTLKSYVEIQEMLSLDVVTAKTFNTMKDLYTDSVKAFPV